MIGNKRLSREEMKALHPLLLRALRNDQIEFNDQVDAKFKMKSYFKEKKIKITIVWNGKSPLPEEAQIAAKRVSLGMLVEPMIGVSLRPLRAAIVPRRESPL